MAKIRSHRSIVAKYGRITPTKSKEYEEGVKDPKKSWLEETTAAAPAWQDGVQEAITRGAFAAGVEECGQAGWLDPAIKLGTRRYRDGVEYSIPKYDKKFAPYHDVIEATDLPPKGAKGDPRNIDRVTVIATALHEEKVRRTTRR